MQTQIQQSQPVLNQRRGKIARLPRDARDQLNVRLDDGQEADRILPWLNALPEVRKIIAERFNGVPVSPQNLSAWRQGGFQEWLLHRELLDTAVHVHENFQELEVALDCESPDAVPLAIADNMTTQLSMRFNAFLAHWSGDPLDSQVAALLKMGQFILKLQQAAYRAQRQTIELSSLRRQAERQDEREMRAELIREQMAEQAAAQKADKLQCRQKSKKTAPKNRPVRPPAPVQSSPIKVNQGSPNQTPASVVIPLPVVGRANRRALGEPNAPAVPASGL